jgi:hypothetical protein
MCTYKGILSPPGTTYVLNGNLDSRRFIYF